MLDLPAPADRIELMSGPEQLLCVHCGYRLFGIAEDGRCPECGTSARWSQPGDRLAAADGTWLWQVTRGQARIVGASLLLFLVYLVFVLAAPALKSRLSPVAFDLSLPIAKVVCHIWLLVGILAVTRQDPRATLIESRWSLRTAVRASAVTTLVLAPLGGGLLPRVGGSAVPIEFFADLYFFTLLVTAAGVTIHLSGLAMRVPDVPLAWSTKSVGVTLAVLALVSVPSGLLRSSGTIGQAFDRSFALGLVKLLSVLISLAVWCYIARTVQLWWACWRVFRRQVATSSPDNRNAGCGD